MQKLQFIGVIHNNYTTLSTHPLQCIVTTRYSEKWYHSYEFILPVKL